MRRITLQTRIPSASRFLLRQSVALLLILLMGADFGFAQESDTPVVAFVVNPEIQSASPGDVGANGASTMAGIFAELNSQVESIDLVDPISPDVDVVVLMRPLRQLTYNFVVRLWDHIQSGGAILVTVDPFVGETAEQGLNELLRNSYGLGMEDYFLIKTDVQEVEPLRSLGGNHLEVYGDNLAPHTITEPILAGGLSIHTWAARTIQVSGLWPGATPNSLLYTEEAYGEFGDIFAPIGGVPLEYNIGTDALGRLLVGGLSTNTHTGSRIVLLGDSEMLENGYGLSQNAESGGPQYPGNFLFAKRVAAWLLDLPPAEWPIS